MTDINILIEMQANHKKALEDAAAIYKERLTDKSLPLDERWDLFEKLSKIGGTLPMGMWIDHSIETIGLEWYDDFYYERYQDVYYSDVAEQLEEMLEDYPDKVTREKVDAWKEIILSKGERGFRYDW